MEKNLANPQQEKAISSRTYRRLLRKKQIKWSVVILLPPLLSLSRRGERDMNMKVKVNMMMGVDERYFVKNLEGKRWWIDEICKGVRTLEKETKIKEIGAK